MFFFDNKQNIVSMLLLCSYYIKILLKYMYYFLYQVIYIYIDIYIYREREREEMKTKYIMYWDKLIIYGSFKN